MDAKCLIPKIKDLPTNVQTQINDSLIKAQHIAQNSNGNREKAIIELKTIQQDIIKLLEKHPECQTILEPTQDEQSMIEFYKYTRYENDLQDDGYELPSLHNIPLTMVYLKELESELQEFLQKHPLAKQEIQGTNLAKKKSTNKTTLLAQRKLLDVRSYIGELQDTVEISKKDETIDTTSKYVFGYCNHEEMITKGKLIYKDVIEHYFGDLERFLASRNIMETGKVIELQKHCQGYLFLLKQLRSVCDIHLRRSVFTKKSKVSADETFVVMSQKDAKYNPDHWKDDFIYNLFKKQFKAFVALPNPFENAIGNECIQHLDQMVKLFGGLSILHVRLDT